MQEPNSLKGFLVSSSEGNSALVTQNLFPPTSLPHQHQQFPAHL